METFLQHQHKADVEFQKREEERWRREQEIEDKRREEDKQHELNMLRVLLQAFQGGVPHNYGGPIQ